METITHAFDLRESERKTGRRNSQADASAETQPSSRCKTRCMIEGTMPSGPDVLPLHNKRMKIVALVGAVASFAAFLVAISSNVDLGPRAEYMAWIDLAGVFLNLGFLFAYRQNLFSSFFSAAVGQLSFFLLNTLLFVALPTLLTGLAFAHYDALGLIVLLRAIFVPCKPKASLFIGLGLWSLYPLSVFVGTQLDPQMAAQLQDPFFWTRFLFGNFDIGLHLAVGLVAVHFFNGLRMRAFQAEQAGNYKLLEKLGEGGMGEVYKARHAMLQRPTVVKMLKAELDNSPTAQTRFEREVQAASELTHSNTISIYDYGRTDSGRFYYAMEYLSGLDLQELVEQNGGLHPGRALFLLDQALGSLGEAHRRQLLHRDIKPSNIFLTERGGEFDFVKVLDFGLVKQMTNGMQSEAGLTADGSITGTPLYMAPEMFYGETPPDHRSDLYSLGAVAYFLLAGHPVFDSKNPVQALIDHARTQPKPLLELGVSVSEKLQSIILTALEKAPEDRYATAEDFRAALRSAPEWGSWDREEARRWWDEHNPQMQSTANQPITPISSSAVAA